MGGMIFRAECDVSGPLPAHLSLPGVFRLRVRGFWRAYAHPMGRRFAITFIATAVACLATAGAASAVKAVAIYANNMGSTAKRAQVVKIAGSNCDRGGSSVALRVNVGRRTDECTYRTPVVGRDVEIFATERLLSGTPRAIRKRTF